MKKKLVGLFVAMLTVGLLAGCGKDEGTNESATDIAVESTEAGTAESTIPDVALKDMDVTQYVTLGEYKGINVTVAPASVDDAQVESLVNELYFSSVSKENGGITDRAVAEGDTVNIDYVGMKDDVAFDGGSATGFNLTIGSGQFIDGFEDGLVGVMPGETVDLNLTFPETYGNTELAGQEVVFTVTVNFIQPAELDAAIIATMGLTGVTDEESLRQFVYDYLYQNAVQAYDSSVDNAVMDAFVQSCTFTEIPAELLQKYEAIARTNITETAAMYGMDGETFAAYFYGMDLETFLAGYCEETVKQSLAMQAVANLENLNLSDEELESELQTNAIAAGYDSVEAYIGTASKEDYREYLMYNRVLDLLVNNAVISNE